MTTTVSHKACKNLSLQMTSLLTDYLDYTVTTKTIKQGNDVFISNQTK